MPSHYAPHRYIFHADKEEQLPYEETEDEKAVGIDIEHEHLQTLNKTKKHFEETGEWPDIEIFAEWIHDDHVTEHPLYYNDKSGLPAMERKLDEIEII